MKIKAELTIQVTYDTELSDEQEITQLRKDIVESLHDAAQHLDDEGLFTRHTDNATADEYTSEVKIDDEIYYNISKQIRGRFKDK